MASSTNTITNKSLITRSISSNSFGIIIREVTYLDGFSPDYMHMKLKHIGAFHGSAFGEKLGFLTFCPRTGTVYVCQTIVPRDKLITYLLFDDVKRFLNQSKVSLSPSMPESEFISSLFQDPVGGFIGSDMIAKLSDELGNLYTDSLSRGYLSMTPPEYSLVIDFVIRYRPVVAGMGHETPHGLYIYPSYSYAKGQPYFVHHTKADGRTRHRLTFTTRKRHIPPFAMLNIDAQALFINQNGVPCQNQAGYANIRMASIPSCINKRMDVILLIPNSPLKQQSKGSVTIVCSSITINGGLEEAPDSELTIDDVRKNLQRTTDKVMKYVDLNRRFYQKYPASATSISNITVFNYDCRKGRIPGCMFDSFKLPISRERYFLQSLRYAIQRRTLMTDDNDLENWTVGRSSTWCVSVVMDMLCIYVNWCNYITDIVDHNKEGGSYDERLKKLIESFDIIRCRDCGDCEDFTREILMAAMELTFNVNAFNNKAIHKVRAIMDRFVFVSVLCGVSKASISFNDLNDKNVKLSGHECALAIPKYIFFKALSRSNPSHPLLTLYTTEEQDKGKEDQICVLEGTGNLDPLPREVTSEYEKIASCIFDEFPDDLTSSIRKQFFYHPRRDDNFYKKFIAFLTPEPFLKFGYRGLEYLVCIEDPRTPGRFIRGVDFNSFLEIDKNPSIRLVEAPQIPVKTFRDCSRIDDDNFPPVINEPVDISQEMVLTAQQFTILREGTKIPEHNDNVFSFQIPLDQVTPEIIEAWRKEVEARKMNMICHPEAVKLNHSMGKIVGGYTIHIFR